MEIKKWFQRKTSCIFWSEDQARRALEDARYNIRQLNEDMKFEKSVHKHGRHIGNDKYIQNLNDERSYYKKLKKCAKDYIKSHGGTIPKRNGDDYTIYYEGKRSGKKKSTKKEPGSMMGMCIDDTLCQCSLCGKFIV